MNFPILAAAGAADKLAQTVLDVSRLAFWAIMIGVGLLFGLWAICMIGDWWDRMTKGK